MSEIINNEGISTQEWIMENVNSLPYDAVSLGQFISYFQSSFLLSKKDLIHYVRLTIYELLNYGAKPVIGAGILEKISPYDWILQEQYGSTKEEIANNIIKEWLLQEDPAPNLWEVWFYIPNEYCFNPDYYQVNKDGVCLATWIKEFIEKQRKYCISLSEIITELQNNFDLSQYQLDYFVRMIIERLYYQGSRPVVKAVSSLSGQYQWVLQIQYGLSASSVGFRIVKKWQENRKSNFEIEQIYFYIPDQNCFIPDGYKEEIDDWKFVIF
ncbi:hypothetical protein [Commensalibacter nepenthis]|uniref:Uncharacterized protein n=1 Tax=Commensalibacter nepenthis TaxID=3043872 RepID=A0ABT6QBY3_9PROT|nr:hypothetical protein [Commensalibacter sp. TBRC 10068]MDI2113850.1 hypothetical protein [Commensalibacter sp. TBRC 10068]